MSKTTSTLELTLDAQAPGDSLPHWLYVELRRAILSGRLTRGSRLPASRELAKQYGIARGSVVAAYEQLYSEGYLFSKIGAGTFVSISLPRPLEQNNDMRRPVPPAAIAAPSLIRPFRPFEPGLNAFPVDLWARVASRRLRKASQSQLAAGDPSGYGPLREVVADYLARSRGVICTPHQVMIVSGTNQALDLILRILIRPGDSVWMEDPGYPSAAVAFQAAQARLIEVPVDAQGLDPKAGQRLAPNAKVAYLTPAHQFPLGVTMPIDRRLAILEWARHTGAHIIEDDYDSEYRFSGPPVPAMQGLDPGGSVIFMGSFSKVLFTSLRLGYLIVPEPLMDRVRSQRASLDRFCPTLDQAILCDFITEGHFNRHLRRMRDLYAERLGALRDSIRRHLNGVLEMPLFDAGLHIPGYLNAGIRAAQIQERAAQVGIETPSLDRFALKRRDLNGLLLGFAAFDARAIQRGVEQLAAAIDAILKKPSPVLH